MILYTKQQKVSSDEFLAKINHTYEAHAIDNFDQKIEITGAKWLSPNMETSTYQFIIPENYTFTVSTLLFNALRITGKYLIKASHP